MAARPGDADDAAPPGGGAGATRTAPLRPDAQRSTPGLHPFGQQSSARQRMLAAIKKAQLNMRTAAQQADEKKQAPDDRKIALQQVTALLSEVIMRTPASKESAERMKENARRQEEWYDDEHFEALLRSSAPSSGEQRDLDTERREAQQILEDVVQQGQLADAFEPFELAIEKFRETGVWEPPVSEPLPENEKTGGRPKLPEFPVGIAILETLPRDARQLRLDILRFIRHRYRITVQQSPGLAPYAQRQIEENLDEHMQEAILVMWGARGLAEWRLFSDPIAALRSVPNLRVGPHLLLMELEARRDGGSDLELPPILKRLCNEEDEAKLRKEEAETKAKKENESENKSPGHSEEEPDSEEERRKNEVEKEAVRKAAIERMRLDPNAPLSLAETPATMQEWRRIERVREERRQKAFAELANQLHRAAAADEAFLRGKAHEQGWTLAEVHHSRINDNKEHPDSAVAIVLRTLRKTEYGTLLLGKDEEHDTKSEETESVAKPPPAEVQEAAGNEEKEKQDAESALLAEMVRAAQEDDEFFAEQRPNEPKIFRLDNFELIASLLNSDDDRLVAQGMQLIDLTGGVQQFADLLKDVTPEERQASFEKQEEWDLRNNERLARFTKLKQLLATKKAAAAKPTAVVEDEGEPVQGERPRAAAPTLKLPVTVDGEEDGYKDEDASEEDNGRVHEFKLRDFDSKVEHKTLAAELKKESASMAAKPPATNADAPAYDEVDHLAELRRVTEDFIRVASEWHKFSHDLQARTVRSNAWFYEQEALRETASYDPTEAARRRKEVLGQVAEMLAQYKATGNAKLLVDARQRMKEAPRLEEGREMTRRLAALNEGKLSPYSPEATQLEVYIHKRMRLYMRMMCRLLNRRFVSLPVPPTPNLHPARGLDDVLELIAPTNPTALLTEEKGEGEGEEEDEEGARREREASEKPSPTLWQTKANTKPKKGLSKKQELELVHQLSLVKAGKMSDSALPKGWDELDLPEDEPDEFDIAYTEEEENAKKAKERKKKAKDDEDVLADEQADEEGDAEADDAAAEDEDSLPKRDASSRALVRARKPARALEDENDRFLDALKADEEVDDQDQEQPEQLVARFLRDSDPQTMTFDQLRKVKERMLKMANEVEPEGMSVWEVVQRERYLKERPDPREKPRPPPPSKREVIAQLLNLLKQANPAQPSWHIARQITDKYVQARRAEEREEEKKQAPFIYDVHVEGRVKQWAAKREELLAKFDDLQAQLALLKANQRYLIGKMYDPRVADLLQQEEDSDDDEDTYTPEHFLPFTGEYAWLQDEEADDEAMFGIDLARDTDVDSLLSERWSHDVGLTFWFNPDGKRDLDAQQKEKREDEQLLPRDVNIERAMNKYNELTGRTLDPKATQQEKLKQWQESEEFQMPGFERHYKDGEKKASNLDQETQQRARRVAMLLRRTMREVLEGHKEHQLRKELRALIGELRARAIFPENKCEFDPPVVSGMECKLLQALMVRLYHEMPVHFEPEGYWGDTDEDEEIAKEDAAQRQQQGGGEEPEEKEKKKKKSSNKSEDGAPPVLTTMDDLRPGREYPSVRSMREFSRRRVFIHQEAVELFGEQGARTVEMLMERRLRRVDVIQKRRKLREKRLDVAARSEFYERDDEFDLTHLRNVATVAFEELEQGIREVELKEMLERREQRRITLADWMTLIADGEELPPEEDEEDIVDQEERAKREGDKEVKAMQRQRKAARRASGITSDDSDNEFIERMAKEAERTKSKRERVQRGHMREEEDGWLDEQYPDGESGFMDVDAMQTPVQGSPVEERAQASSTAAAAAAAAAASAKGASNKKGSGLRGGSGNGVEESKDLRNLAHRAALARKAREETRGMRKRAAATTAPSLETSGSTVSQSSTRPMGTTANPTRAEVKAALRQATAKAGLSPLKSKPGKVKFPSEEKENEETKNPSHNSNVLLLRARIAAELAKRSYQPGGRERREKRLAELKKEIEDKLRAQAVKLPKEPANNDAVADDEEKLSGQRWTELQKIAARGGPLLETEIRIAIAATEARDQKDRFESGEFITPQDMRKDPAFQAMIALGARFEAAVANAELAMAKSEKPDDASIPEPFAVHDPSAEGQVDASAWKDILARSIAADDAFEVEPVPDSPVLASIPSMLKYEPLVLNRKVKSKAQLRKEREERKHKREMEKEEAEESGALPGMEGMMGDEEGGGGRGKRGRGHPMDYLKRPPPIPGIPHHGPPRKQTRFQGDLHPKRGITGGYAAAGPSRAPRTEEERKAAQEAKEKRQVTRTKSVAQMMAEQRHQYRRQLESVRLLEAPWKRLRLAMMEQELLRVEAAEAKAEGREHSPIPAVMGARIPGEGEEEESSKGLLQWTRKFWPFRSPAAKPPAPAAPLGPTRATGTQERIVHADPEEQRRYSEALQQLEAANAAFHDTVNTRLPKAVLESPFVRALRDINSGARGGDSSNSILAQLRHRRRVPGEEDDVVAPDEQLPRRLVPPPPSNVPRTEDQLKFGAVQCPAFWLGCTWLGKEEEVSVHLNCCEIAAGLVLWYNAQPWHCPGSKNGCTWLGNRSVMGRHMRQCTFIDPFTVSCPRCDFRAQPGEALDEHLMTCELPLKDAEGSQKLNLDITELVEDENFNARRLIEEERKRPGDPSRSREDHLRAQIVLLRYAHATSPCNFRPDENRSLEEHISECPYMHRNLRTSVLPTWREARPQYQHCIGEVLGCPFISRDPVQVSMHTRRCKYAEKYVRVDSGEVDADEMAKRMLAQEDNSVECGPDGPVRCSARRYGCQWIGIAEEYRPHFQRCDYVQEAVREAVERSLKLKFERVMRKEGWVKCVAESHGCKWFGEVEEAEYHVRGCEYVQNNKPCPAAEFGCKFQGNFDAVHEHFYRCEYYFKVQYGLKIFTLKRRYAGMAMVNYLRNSKAGPPMWLANSWVGRAFNPTLLGLFFQPKFSNGEAVYLLHMPANITVVAVAVFGWVGLIHWKAWYYG